MTTAASSATSASVRNRASAAWLRAQLGELAREVSGNPRSWPAHRILGAQRAIAAGDEHWRLAAADALAAGGAP